MFTKKSLRAFYLLAMIGLSAGNAVAQTMGTAINTNEVNPKGVGVTKQTAVEATEKAIPRSDVGTVVRTDKPAKNQATTNSKNTEVFSPAPDARASAVEKKSNIVYRPRRADRN